MPCGKKIRIPRSIAKVVRFGTPKGANLISEAQKIDQIKLGRKLRNAPRYPRKGF